ncbi:hypothetical protein DL766_001512 [Monosporascus sp. MC13-8B]|uniref:Uncharacterized protein n=1 Tax=Monosporascus cannonballus TaxID=155416 RepID=A0ABY0H4Q0_9PEZI|nr:hypothetical protein DL762_006573 [Monosporascus cannonballus]RYO99849.1 hypothetical protein DL763_001239 [Monosporascus cannonballus]RYP37518.1 hypothetical protein DL766_001512 [Monosporascus sp. MC13-8B]
MARAEPPRLPALRDVEDTKAGIVHRCAPDEVCALVRCSKLREAGDAREDDAADIVSVEEAEHDDGGSLAGVDVDKS